MRKKGLVVSICFALAATAVLAGCSPEKKAATPPASTANQDAVTINFYHWYNEETGNWSKVIKAFEEKNPGIKVQSKPLVDNVSAPEYLKKLDLMTASGEYMDVVMFHDAGEFAKRVKIGMMEPLDGYLSKDGVDVSKEYLIDPKIDGKYYGLPAKYIIAMIMLNKKQLDEAGLPIPQDWTWKEFAEYAKKLTKGEGPTKTYGAFLRDQYLHYTLNMSGLPQDSYIIKDDSSSNITNPLFKQSLELRNQMENIDKSSVPLSDTISQKLDYRQQFFTGKANMLIAGSWMISEWGNFKPDFEIAWAPYPKNSPSDPAYYARTSGDIIGVAKSSKHKEAAYKFARWFSTEGIVVQGLSLPGWKQADQAKAVDTLIAGTKTPQAVDKKSLMDVLGKSVGSKIVIPPAYGPEVEKAFVDEAQLYLFDKQNVDTTLTKIQEKVQKIMTSNKK
ncbi:extracellular solute-binding protein [Paenibacillus sp. WQ 127069]|uniref:Extracellular solute-binding protein n=1 Tax=Paenibacillus baimaensis TaxID=2982185 RepID=A0ABT2U9P4_9BACL|nr:extracellular solute-binding protein [Paenibacillus sp. WQ 127069]MCU6791363.1 extracellular solute-binding protein [Paenibacillus sp. WQ 127069]